jgi:hypothetical protein
MTTFLGLLLVTAMVATVYVDWLREFFDLTYVQPYDWALVIVAVLGALAGQFLITRYWPLIIDFLIAKPGPSGDLRGRAT